MKNNDPAQQLAEAERRRDEILKQIPNLQADIERKTASRASAKDVLDHAEGDFLIGTVTDAKLADKRKALDQSRDEVNAAQATLRKAHADVDRLNEVITRLGPQVHAARIKHFNERQAELLREAERIFGQLEPVMNELHNNYSAAEAEFPSYSGRRGPRPYPVAAGLMDMSWRELRFDPNGIHGGRLYAWRKAVSDFFNPPVPVAPRQRRMPAPTAEPVSQGPWYPLPKEG